MSKDHIYDKDYTPSEQPKQEYYPSSRKEAKMLGLKYYRKKTPCKNGHWTPRRVERTKCPTCQNLYKELKRKEKFPKIKKPKYKEEGSYCQLKLNPLQRKQKQLFLSARSRAKELNIPFTLKRNDINVPSTCPVLNIPLNLFNKKLADDSPSLDRVVPAKGYTKENTRVISMKANRLKNSLTLEDLTRILNYVKESLD